MSSPPDSMPNSPERIVDEVLRIWEAAEQPDEHKEALPDAGTLDQPLGLEDDKQAAERAAKLLALDKRSCAKLEQDLEAFEASPDCDMVEMITIWDALERAIAIKQSARLSYDIQLAFGSRLKKTFDWASRSLAATLLSPVEAVRRDGAPRLVRPSYLGCIAFKLMRRDDDLYDEFKRIIDLPDPSTFSLSISVLIQGCASMERSKGGGAYIIVSDDLDDEKLHDLDPQEQELYRSLFRQASGDMAPFIFYVGTTICFVDRRAGHKSEPVNFIMRMLEKVQNRGSWASYAVYTEDDDAPSLLPYAMEFLVNSTSDATSRGVGMNRNTFDNTAYLHLATTADLERMFKSAQTILLSDPSIYLTDPGWHRRPLAEDAFWGRFDSSPLKPTSVYHFLKGHYRRSLYKNLVAKYPLPSSAFRFTRFEDLPEKDQDALLARDAERKALTMAAPKKHSLTNADTNTLIDLNAKRFKLEEDAREAAKGTKEEESRQKILGARGARGKGRGGRGGRMKGG